MSFYFGRESRTKIAFADSIELHAIGSLLLFKLPSYYQIIEVQLVSCLRNVCKSLIDSRMGDILVGF